MAEHSGVIQIHPARELREPNTDQRLLAETSNEIERARREGFAQIEWDEAQVRRPYLVLSDGTLWKRAPGIPVGGA